MKTKAQKQEELQKGNVLLSKSEALLFADFSKVKTVDVRRLREELTRSGNPLFVIKKRLLGLLLKEKGIAFESKEMKAPVGTVFAANLERAAGILYQFLNKLETEKKIEGQRILGGFDLRGKSALDPQRLLFIGQLPPREVLLAQFAGLLAAPIRAFLYILKAKSQRSE